MSVRKVQQRGLVDFQGDRLRVGKAFVGELIGLRATTTEGVFEVRYCEVVVGQVDLKTSHPGGPAIGLSRGTSPDV